MYKSSVVIARMDYLMMEQGAGEKVFPKAEFMAMVSESLCTPIEQIWRVQINEDGSVRSYSFAMPQEKNLPAATCLNTAALPKWIGERLAVLQICNEGDTVAGVGQKLSERVFYVIQ